MANQGIELVQRFGISKSGIESVADAIATSVKEGEQDPLLVAANLKSMETLIASVKKKLADVITDSAYEYPENSFTKHGVKFTKGARKTYDYSSNPNWVEVDAKRKSIESLMKAIKEPIADPETGEIIDPPAFKTSEFISITLAK